MDLIEEIQNKGPKKHAKWRDLESDVFWRQFPFKWNNAF
jgi:hypothetical protein